MSSDAYPHLGFDPVPGDLEGTDEIAGTIRDIAGQSSTTHTTMAGISTSNGIWVGRSADAFSESFDEVPPYLERATTALDAAARALENWSESLAGFKSRANALEEEAATAQQAVNTAQTALDDLTDDDDDEEERKAALTAANEGLTSVRTRAENLNSEFLLAADETARQLANAADDAPAAPGFWDKVGDFLSGVVEFLTDPNVWKLIGDLLSDIAMIIGVICLIAVIFFSGPAGWLVWAGFLAAGGALLFHGMAMAGGAEGVSWKTLAFDLVGFISGGIGLIGGSIAKAGMATLAAGRAIRAAGGVKNFFRSIGPRMKGWMLIATGRFLDYLGLGTGNAGAAVGQADRVIDGGPSWKDIPIIGPIGELTQWRPSEDDQGAPGDASGSPVDTSQMLAGAGDSFVNTLEAEDMGVAA
ncbi:hypothetical protein GCM10009716_11860 [Streptomyces sodiiphilus]|uniref:Putative T7SS secretion signal domain-containing protein n=1 Tax=Streptomyces sodiiphilus TaxID=226217 RepID=A0ABN2NXZ8_9ACTN